MFALSLAATLGSIIAISVYMKDADGISFIKPDNFVFVFAAIIFVSGLVNIYYWKKNLTHPDFVMFFLPAYSLIIVVWKIASQFLK